MINTKTPLKVVFVCFLFVFNATYNNISIISWRSVLLVEEPGGLWENNRPVTRHWQTLLYTSPWSRFGFATVVIGTGCTVSCKSNYHTISTIPTIWLMLINMLQEDYDQLRPLAYPETDVFLICFAINNKTSFDNITDKWIPEIKKHCPDVPVVIVGCKMGKTFLSRTPPYLMRE